MSAEELPWYRVHFRTKQIIVHGDDELARIRARKVPKVVAVEPAKVHQCDYCGKREAWLESWCWYGSYEDLDNGRSVLKFCSDICKERYAIDPDRPQTARDNHAAEDLATSWRDRSTIQPMEPKQFDVVNYRMVDDAKRAADPRVFPHPKHPEVRTGNGWCRWCGERVNEKGRKTWHSACLTTFFLHTSLEAQRAHLRDRDGPRCQGCGSGGWVDGGLMPAWMISRSDSAGNYVWGPAHWIMLPPLEVDHIVELWEVIDLPPDERRAYFGPDNLWLLCPACHKRKSAEAAARRAASRSEGAPGGAVEVIGGPAVEPEQLGEPAEQTGDRDGVEPEG